MKLYLLTSLSLKTILKLLKTADVDIVKYCQDQFGFKLPSEPIPNRTENFIQKL